MRVLDVVLRSLALAAGIATAAPAAVAQLPIEGSQGAMTQSGILIDSGGEGDHWFVGGNIVDRGHDLVIKGTNQPRLYQTERWGLTGYEIPVGAGKYDVRLHFVETYQTVAGNRIFTVTAEGREVAGGLDVFGEAGGRNIALVKEARDIIVDDGVLNIAFVGGDGGAMVSAIEVFKAGVLARLPAPPVVVEPPVVVVPPPVVEPPVVATGDCDPENVPAYAAELGLKKLAFCEPFDDPKRVNMGNRLEPGQTFASVGDGNPVFGGKVNPASAYKWKDGTLTITPPFANYFAQLTTLAGTRNGWKGFALEGAGWCAEIRWSHPKNGERPAFWSMDSRHWFLNDKSGMPRYLEPDFIEWIQGRYIGALHNHVEPSSTQRKSSHVIDSGNRQPPVDPTQFYNAAACINSDSTEYSRWVNGKRLMYGYNATDDRKVSYHDSVPTPDWVSMFKNYHGPVMVGTGPGAPIKIAYIRVWTR